MFGLLLVVWLSLSLQACAVAQFGQELAVDRSVTVETPGLASDHSGHENDSQCAHCLDCDHDGCTKLSCCDGPVVASIKAETRQPDDVQLDVVTVLAADPIGADLFTHRVASAPPVTGVSLSKNRLYIRNCVYLI